MLRENLASIVQSAVDSLIASDKLPFAVREVPIEIIEPRQPEHGDFACNFAMMATKKAGMNPRAIGELLRAELMADDPDAARDMVEEGDPIARDAFDPFAEIEVAGPGFINFRLRPEYLSAYLPQVLSQGADFGKSETSHPQNLNVEFVSVNPNGPITVGSGRGAAFGDTLSRVLAATGNRVTKEYYVNDGVNSEQMRLFAESVKSYVQGTAFPEKGYKGEYVQDVASEIKADPTSAHEDTPWFQQKSQALMVERQRGDLETFGTAFDLWFREQSMHDSGEVSRAIDKLKGLDSVYSSPTPRPPEHPERGREGTPVDDDEAETVAAENAAPALWLKSMDFGDDKDRVVLRSDGRPAYIAGDIAYLENKLGIRRFDKSLLIVGPDHHGYIPRLYAAYQALGFPMRDGKPERFEMIIFQIVRFLKDGKPAPMRKRDGNIYELRDLIEELGKAAALNADTAEQMRVGRDVSRFFYLMRSHETHMDFDIDLATKQSDENPVFYVQYAHARISSVLAKAGPPSAHPVDFRPLVEKQESALIKKILDLPNEIARCAEDYGVHRLTTYAIELARTFHHFYDACRVIQPDRPELTAARLELCRAAQIALRNVLNLLGVSAPESLQRG